jgi:AraC-like DNA-binding protein
MQDYIEEHIQDPITLSDLARAAGYSQWHAARVFKELTGKAPFEYVRALRLTKAALLLRDEQPRIVDVAFDFVFASHEGFTRAFSRQFGVSPVDYRRNPKQIRLFMPDRARDRYLKLQKGEIEMATDEVAKTVFVQVVERPARKVIMKRGVRATHYFEYCGEVGCDVWDVLSHVKEAMYEPIGMWLPEGMITPGTSAYVQGVEVPVDYSGAVPDGFELMDLPPCMMMVFQGEPYDDCRFQEAIGEVWDVMKRYNPEVYGFEWADEDAPRFQLAPMGYRGYIEARPVRPVSKG